MHHINKNKDKRYIHLKVECYDWSVFGAYHHLFFPLFATSFSLAMKLCSIKKYDQSKEVEPEKVSSIQCLQIQLYFMQKSTRTSKNKMKVKMKETILIYNKFI